MFTFDRRRFFASSVGLAAMASIPASAFAGTETIRREAGVKLKLGLNAYSFNKQLHEGSMSLADAVHFCAKQVMSMMPEAVSIFILPPSPEVLEMRLRHRSEAEHMTSEEVIERRLQQARSELEQVGEYKYALVNDVLDQATAEMRAIMLYQRGVRDGVVAMAESCRTDTRSPRLAAVLASFHVD